MTIFGFALIKDAKTVLTLLVTHTFSDGEFNQSSIHFCTCKNHDGKQQMLESCLPLNKVIHD